MALEFVLAAMLLLPNETRYTVTPGYAVTKVVARKELPRPKISRTVFAMSGMHSHKCPRCKNVWVHPDGSGYREHFCPECGTGPVFTQYQTFR